MGSDLSALQAQVEKDKLDVVAGLSEHLLILILVLVAMPALECYRSDRTLDGMLHAWYMVFAVL